jgi:hypothetical protein
LEFGIQVPSDWANLILVDIGKIATPDPLPTGETFLKPADLPSEEVGRAFGLSSVSAVDFLGRQSDKPLRVRLSDVRETIVESSKGLSL